MTGRHLTGEQCITAAMERPIDYKLDSKSLEIENISPSVAASLRRILQMTAITSEEKFKVLDARDKLYKIVKDKDPTLKRGALMATCLDMCPEKERLLREYQGRGSIFEMTNFSKNSNFNHRLAVKEYARSSADQEEPLPHDLRPVHVLSMTMSHLLHNVVDFCEFSDDNLEEWYMFMWDRTRALRKELTQQGVCSLESVTLVEQCARFHIHSAERLVDQDSAIYDDKINTENLTKCLQTLKYMYKDLAKEDVKCPNESEFIGYSLLLNLNNSSVFTDLSNMPTALMTSESVKFALDMMTAWSNRNFIRFFNLIKNTTYLNCCLLRRYFEEMRLHAIKTMICSYCTKNYSPQIPVCRFVENLNFEGEEDCVNFLSRCNFKCLNVNGETVVNFDRVLFQNPTSTNTSGRAYIFIEEKKKTPLSQIMAGGALPKLCEDYTPHSSFTASGELKPESLLQTDLFDISSLPVPAPKNELSDIKTTTIQSTSSIIDIFSKGQNLKSSQIRDERLQKGTGNTTGFSSAPLFSVKEDPPSENVFASGRSSIFGKTCENSSLFQSPKNSVFGAAGNIFGSNAENQTTKNLFGNLGSSVTFDRKENKIFGSETKTKPTFTFTSTANNDDQSQSYSGFGISSETGTEFHAKQDKILDRVKENKERDDMQRFEKEEQHREEENRIKKQEEQEKEKINQLLLEKKIMEEENQRKELERKEREKSEREEKKKKEELAKIERERRSREEKVRQEQLIKANAELKRLEENKRIAELEHQRKINTKIADLRKKIQKWKTKNIFEKWRMKTWTSIEEQKMKKYFTEMKVKYPPVCSEEMLNGNPYGLVIPSILTFGKFHNWKKENTEDFPKKLLLLNDELPLLKINNILGKDLEDRAKSLGNKLDPFLWKLAISVPDELESSAYWKSIETFVQMHFVENFRWQFDQQKGPLYCRSGCYGSFRFNVSIRRFRGCDLYEGREPSPSAMEGCNALIFFLTEGGNQITTKRLRKVLESKPRLPKIPVVVFALNNSSEEFNLKKVLELEVLEKTHISQHFIVPVTNGKHQLVMELKKCLHLAAKHSAPPPSLRIAHLFNFLNETWLASVWRRIEIGLSNFKIVLKEPKVIIEFYNSCLDDLLEIFLEDNYDNQMLLGEEFSNTKESRPNRSLIYTSRLSMFLHRLKLPRWPAETPKSSHQLNYRIHQYCKKIVGENRMKMKRLKWLLYQIIRRSLLWKGLDIYCNEDITEILKNFPWIQVFQEISRTVTRNLSEEIEGANEFLIMYNYDEIEELNFGTSFISKFMKNSNKRSPKKNLPMFGSEVEELNPCLEKDSVVYAYSIAVERGSNKRKREEYIDESLDALFSSPAGKRMIFDEGEPKHFNYSEIRNKLNNLDDSLDSIKRKITENSKMLLDIQRALQ